MKNKALGIIFLVLVFAAVVAGIYYLKYGNGSVACDGAKGGCEGSLAATENFKTYTNTRYGFQLQYPENWVQDGETLYSQAAPKGIYGVSDRISIDVRPNASQSSLKDWLAKNRTDMVISDKGSVAVAGVTGLQYIEGGMVNYLVTYAPGSNFVVNLTTPANSNYLSEYNQILSTLKFADDNLKMVQPCPPGKLCE